MAGKALNKDTKIYTYGQPVTALHLIAEGKVLESYSGGSLVLGKGDVIGICELCSEIHFMEYTVVENATLLTYPITNIEALEAFIQEHPDVSKFFLLSAFRQIGKLFNACSLSQVKCSNLHQEMINDYETYNQLCAHYRLAARPLEGVADFAAYLGDETPDLWLSGLYAGFSRLYAGQGQKVMLQEPVVSLGLLRKCSLDFRKTYLGLEEHYRYLRSLGNFYFEKSGNDLFDRYMALYTKLGADCEHTAQVHDALSRMIQHFSGNNDCDPSAVQQRVLAFRSAAERINTPAPAGNTDTADISSGSLPDELTGSLNTILDYIGADLDVTNSFRTHIQTYKNLPDRASMEPECVSVRRHLTDEFYSLYSVAFERTLSVPDIPLPVRMFLYFGYVDEDLAGHNNTLYLYSLAKQMTSREEFGVYTFYDWLLAIFSCKKVPSRNEFDQDYSDYIHKQNASGNVSEAELRELEQSAMGKVNFELRNLFPQANKVTFGRVATFCPIFSSDNVLKDLKSAYVTISQLGSIFSQIKQVDYTAFYRECLDTEHIDVMGKEPIHVEYMPDIILMPNVGVRGVMWQEIEGKVRNSPSRMFLSIFHLEDLPTTIIHMVGEFRWELCKRVQGGRWNDLSDPSLTSEYYDYVQFYRKNQELSSEAKERMRTSLQRAKNSFKEMFVRDYIIWILFEGKGAPRLNKVARKILFTYCPFPQAVCDSLKDNPLYSEILDRRRIKTAQRLHHLDMLAQKLMRSGTPVPESLEEERYYVSSIRK